MLAFHCSKNKNNSNFKIDKTNFVIVFLSLLNSNSNNSNKLLQVTGMRGSQLFHRMHIAVMLWNFPNGFLFPI